MRGECGSRSRPGRTVGCHQGPDTCEEADGRRYCNTRSLARPSARMGVDGACRFAGLVVVVAAVVVPSGDSLIGLVFTVVVCLPLGGAALQGVHQRKVWKRWLNLALVMSLSLWRSISSPSACGKPPVCSPSWSQRSPTGWPPGRRSPTPHWPPQGSAQPRRRPDRAAGQSPLRRWHCRPGRPRWTAPASVVSACMNCPPATTR